MYRSDRVQNATGYPTCPTMLGALEAFFSREQRLKTRGFFPGQRAGRWSTYDQETATSRPRAASQNCTDTPGVAVATGQALWKQLAAGILRGTDRKSTRLNYSH